MDKKEEKLARLFPDYYSKFALPDGAHEEEILVYRACKTGECDNISFTPSFEENGYKYFIGDDPLDSGVYSLSTYEKPKDVKRFTKFTSEYGKPYRIAVGETHHQYGLVQRTKERTKTKSSHIDWWLYKDVRPYEAFTIIDNFEEYLEEYKRKEN